MKVIRQIFICFFLFASVDLCYAQEKEDTTSSIGQDLKQAGKATGRAVKKAAKTVGNKTAEVGAKGAAELKDRSLKNVKGPAGETVYVDKYEKKYYINKQGKRIYLK